jgi:fructose-specific phosphotransferase system component IIB
MSGQIQKITKNKLTQADLPATPVDHQLPLGKKCQGKFSIQREINQIIKHDYPKEWAKKVCDKSAREKIRRQLRSQSEVLWCDAKVGECAC